MLFQDDVGGLEVESPARPGVFLPAPPVKGAIVFNIGDFCMRWSNGKYSGLVGSEADLSFQTSSSRPFIEFVLRLRRLMIQLGHGLVTLFHMCASP